MIWIEQLTAHSADVRCNPLSESGPNAGWVPSLEQISEQFVRQIFGFQWKLNQEKDVDKIRKFTAKSLPHIFPEIVFAVISSDLISGLEV
ncbi:hypothetical protein ACM44_04185 [Chryseobacterium koreense CCUG 49689]|uniref:Uncharacterized protein n=1 Tax=Chryseobacterium koreense CCUG 49689 TaxID=1304281 RepID=A0A0J7LTF6_9FLAO|nr:hypothetical protein [Chryseobacterium koreense]KMQ72210.1 hypothetical protein ACM44_04185 [Chryseobacterium koreense CCUG 49689]MBB5334624.1 hypothetical protein [Chryseobacterium koreense]